MVRSTEPSNAGTNPRTRKPGDNIEASFNSTALMTSRKSPSVTNVNGKAKNRKIRPTVTSRMAITAVAIRASAKFRTTIPGITLATIHSARAPTSQLTIRCTSIAALRPEIMISHGDVVCRNLRLCISCLEARILPGKASGQPVSEALRPTAQLRGDQLHVPASANGVDPPELGGGDASGLRLCRESKPADHAYPGAEERRGSDGAFPEDDRSPADFAAAGSDPVPVAAALEVRRGPAAGLSGVAAPRNAVCL